MKSGEETLLAKTLKVVKSWSELDPTPMLQDLLAVRIIVKNDGDGCGKHGC